MKFMKGKKCFLLQFFYIISNSAIKWCTGNRDKGYKRWRFRTTTLYTQCCYDLCTRVWSCETFSVVVVTINIWIDVNWRIRNGKIDVFHPQRMFDQRQHGHQSRCRVKPVSSGYPRDSPVSAWLEVSFSTCSTLSRDLFLFGKSIAELNISLLHPFSLYKVLTTS